MASNGITDSTYDEKLRVDKQISETAIDDPYQISNNKSGLLRFRENAQLQLRLILSSGVCELVCLD